MPQTITEMYDNTIPLLKSNFEAIDNIVLIDATPQNDFFTVAEYNKALKELDVRNQSPNWFKNDLRPFIEHYIAR